MCAGPPGPGPPPIAKTPPCCPAWPIKFCLRLLGSCQVEATLPDGSKIKVQIPAAAIAMQPQQPLQPPQQPQPQEQVQPSSAEQSADVTSEGHQQAAALPPVEKVPEAQGGQEERQQKGEEETQAQPSEQPDAKDKPTEQPAAAAADDLLPKLPPPKRQRGK